MNGSYVLGAPEKALTASPQLVVCAAAACNPETGRLELAGHQVLEWMASPADEIVAAAYLTQMEALKREQIS